VSRVALLWIVWQAGTLAAAPMFIAYQAPGDALTDHLCDCPDATPGRQCPMHHHSNSSQQPTAGSSVARCSMRAPVTPTDLALASIAMVTGMLPVRTVALPAVEFADFAAAAPARAFTRAVPPLSPPPEI